MVLLQLGSRDTKAQPGAGVPTRVAVSNPEAGRRPAVAQALLGPHTAPTSQFLITLYMLYLSLHQLGPGEILYQSGDKQNSKEDNTMSGKQDQKALMRPKRFRQGWTGHLLQGTVMRKKQKGCLIPHPTLGCLHAKLKAP